MVSWAPSLRYDLDSRHIAYVFLLRHIINDYYQTQEPGVDHIAGDTPTRYDTTNRTSRELLQSGLATRRTRKEIRCPRYIFIVWTQSRHVKPYRIWCSRQNQKGDPLLPHSCKTDNTSFKG